MGAMGRLSRYNYCGHAKVDGQKEGRCTSSGVDERRGSVVVMESVVVVACV